MARRKLLTFPRMYVVEKGSEERTVDITLGTLVAAEGRFDPNQGVRSMAWMAWWQMHGRDGDLPFDDWLESVVGFDMEAPEDDEAPEDPLGN